MTAAFGDILGLATLVLPAAYAALSLSSLLRSMRAVPHLGRAEETRADGPRVSVIVPACNEAETLEAALASKLSSRYPNLEIVVVDDRSTDETGAILDRLAASDPRVVAVHVRELPAGWLGKLHAMDRGLAASTGDIIVFSDADVRFAPDLIGRAVRTLESEGLDFFTLLPEIRPSGFAIDAALTTMLRLLLSSGRLWRVRDPKSAVAVGGGIFNLVRRDALLRSPGIAWLKLEVADDVAFGQMMKSSGARCGVFAGHDALSLAFYDSVPQFVRGLEKNSYAVTGFRPAVAVPMQFVLAYLELYPVLGFFLFAAQGLMAAAALAAALTLATSAAQLRLARWVGRPLASAMVPALGPALMLFASVRSLVLTHARGGVVWRGTFYDLETLRRETRLRRSLFDSIRRRASAQVRAR